MKKKYILTLEFEAEITEKVFPKSGWHPQPISRFAAAPKKGILKKLVFLTNFYKVLIKRGRRPQPISRFSPHMRGGALSRCAAAPKQGIAKKLVFLTNICKDRYFTKLFSVLLKSDQTILEIYRNLLMSDLGDGNHIYEIDKDIRTLKVRDDIEVLNPVIKLLPADEKNHFIEILASEDKTTDDFYDFLYCQFGGLMVKGAKFTEKNI